MNFIPKMSNVYLRGLLNVLLKKQINFSYKKIQSISSYELETLFFMYKLNKKKQPYQLNIA